MNIFQEQYFLTFFAIFLALKSENFRRFPELENTRDFDENLAKIEKIEIFGGIKMVISDWTKHYFIVQSEGLAEQIGNWQITGEYNVDTFGKLNILRFFEIFYYFIIILQIIGKFYQKLRKNRISKRFRTNRRIYFTQIFQIFKPTNQR